MRKVVLSVIGAVLIFGISAYVWTFQNNVFLTTSSPKNTYTVELVGNKFSPRLPLAPYDHEARLNLSKNCRPIVKNALLMRYDWLDSDFNDHFPDHIWETESILRFGSDISNSKKRSCSLIVQNKTTKKIKFLKVNITDMFLFFEMTPNSATVFSVPCTMYVTGAGEFEDGQVIENKGVSFRDNGTAKESPLYSLSIYKEKLMIENSDFESH